MSNSDWVFASAFTLPAPSTTPPPPPDLETRVEELEVAVLDHEDRLQFLESVVGANNG